MKKILFLLPITLLVLACTGQNPNKVELKTGDVIFQDFSSGLSTPIKLITQSDYSHVGVVVMVNGEPKIYEAVQPVRLADVDDWINRNTKGKYVVKRHKKADSLFTKEKITQIEAFYKKHLNKNYDIKFAWSDDDMYCSELVWKMYKEVFDVEIGKQQLLEDLDASHPAVKAKLKELFGNDIPWKETVVSPQSLYEYEQLTTVFKN